MRLTKMIDRRISYLESYKEDNEITYYFDAPAEYTKDYDPNSESTLISVEFTEGHCEPKYASVAFGVVINGEVTEWRDVSLPYDEVGELLDLGMKYSHFE